MVKCDVSSWPRLRCPHCLVKHWSRCCQEGYVMLGRTLTNIVLCGSGDNLVFNIIAGIQNLHIFCVLKVFKIRILDIIGILISNQVHLSVLDSKPLKRDDSLFLFLTLRTNSTHACMIFSTPQNMITFYRLRISDWNINIQLFALILGKMKKNWLIIFMPTLHHIVEGNYNKAYR